MLQAELLKIFYTVFFSHPAVSAITYWNFYRAWQPGSGFLRDDFTVKPMLFRLEGPHPPGVENESPSSHRCERSSSISRVSWELPGSHYGSLGRRRTRSFCEKRRFECLCASSGREEKVKKRLFLAVVLFVLFFFLPLLLPRSTTLLSIPRRRVPRFPERSMASSLRTSTMLPMGGYTRSLCEIAPSSTGTLPGLDVLWG